MARAAPAFANLAAEYARMFDSAELSGPMADDAEQKAKAIAANRATYEALADTGVPWWLIGVIHAMECSDFPRRTQHLHNGDSLQRRTRNVPAGRPVAGDPPFSWDESARDALAYDKLTRVTDWTLERALYALEAYNGFGSRWRGVHTAYLWSGTQHYSRGKFTSDGVWNREHVSGQPGAAAMLAALLEIVPDLSIARYGMAAPAPVGSGHLAVTKSRTIFGALTSAIGYVVFVAKYVFDVLPDIATKATELHDPAERMTGLLGVNLPLLGLFAAVLGTIIVVEARRTAAVNFKTG